MFPNDVSMEDLLGRRPLHVDLETVRKNLEGRVLLVTGAAGSIGSALCREIHACNPGKLICVDRREGSLNLLRNELGGAAARSHATFIVQDVANVGAMQHIFSEHHVEIVFHAAAHKHVPEMETREVEAVSNNIFALESLLDVAQENRCGAFLLISSDKAVNPVSVMGATKRVGELILATRPSENMRCVSVRFGNVLGSSGSVIPILRDQLRRDQPLTITDYRALRFFMTSREAVSLVLQASTMGFHGDILVLEMGAPINILDLARKLIRLSGAREAEAKFEFIGLRSGEKLQEELFYADEAVTTTTCEEIKRVRRPYGNWTGLKEQLDGLRNSVSRRDANDIRERLRDIVPEFRDWHPADKPPDY